VEAYFKFSNESAINGYYYLNNFENVISSFVTLFELTVVNNWYILMEGYAATVPNGEWSRIYFMCFYLTISNLSLDFNILNGFI